ncbi:MAG: hypothetical protein WC584_03505 [Candidatus Pacearchaeota archaeon]
MKKGVEVFFIVLLIVFIFSISFASANSFGDFFKKAFGKKVYFSPDSTSNLNLAFCQSHPLYSSPTPVTGQACCFNKSVVNSNAIAVGDQWNRFLCYNGQMYVHDGVSRDTIRVNTSCRVVGNYYAYPNYPWNATKQEWMGGWKQGNGNGVACGEGKICSNGVCVVNQTQQNATCTDSDGGLNYYVKGNVYDNGEWINGRSDACVDSNFNEYPNAPFLSEGSCESGRGRHTSFNCSNGCSNGACVSALGGSCSVDATRCNLEWNSSICGNVVSSANGYEELCNIPSPRGGSAGFSFQNDGCSITTLCQNGCSNGACMVQESGCRVLYEGETVTIVATDSDGTTYDVSINFIGVGSVKLNVNSEITRALARGDSHTLSDGTIITINEINTQDYAGGIKRVSFCLRKPTCTPRYYCQTRPAICPRSGVQTKECQDFECETRRYTEEVQCNPGECAGCQLEGTCIPYGFRKQVTLYRNDPGTYNLYCEMDGELREQKSKDSSGNWATCQNNYECTSNVCSSGECYEIQDMINEAGRLKTLFFNILCKVFNPISSTEYNQCLINFLGGSSSGGEESPGYPQEISGYRLLGQDNISEYCRNIEDSPDVPQGIIGRVCTEGVRLQYQDTQSNKGIFVSLTDITQGKNIYEQLINNLSTPVTIDTCNSCNLFRIEDHEIGWFDDQFDIVLTQEFTIENNGTSYHYSFATGDNPVTRWLLGKYLPTRI